jgi:hypothetical protein
VDDIWGIDFPATPFKNESVFVKYGNLRLWH